MKDDTGRLIYIATSAVTDEIQQVAKQRVRMLYLAMGRLDVAVVGKI